MAPTRKPGHRGVRHVLKAFGYSLKGLRAAFAHEEAFRLELIAVAVLLPAALWLGAGGVEKALLAGSLLVVLIVELVNSAVEAVVDRVGTESHELSGRAKDVGSAAVFMALVNVAVTWGLVLGERFF
ncbi:MAG TPA: diacylglycerol kinase [Gammaproteobacteria bacterium]|nr:diacylglycerol kinase [Gammaproteobacteria bacterium]